jgi:hypothetical protein
METQSASLRDIANPYYENTGLDLFKPPKESFRDVANRPRSMVACRHITSSHMMRAFWFDVASRYVDFILSQDPDAVNEQWLDFRKTLETNSRIAASLLLSHVPFYVTPGSGPLSPTSVYSLVWPLSVLVTCQLITPEQKEYAKDILFQIGTRASLPLALKMAEEHRSQDLYEQVHMLHFTWQH